MMAYFVHSGWFAMGSHGDLPFGTIELIAGNKDSTVHILSIIFAGWAAAMVSKTLRVSRRAVCVTDVRFPSCKRRVLTVRRQRCRPCFWCTLKSCEPVSHSTCAQVPNTSGPHRLRWLIVVNKPYPLNNSNNSALYTQLLRCIDSL